MKFTLITIISLLTLTSAETCYSLYKGQTCNPNCAIFECEATPKPGMACLRGFYLVKKKVKCGKIGKCYVPRSGETTDQYQCVYDFDCVSIFLFLLFVVELDLGWFFIVQCQIEDIFGMGWRKVCACGEASSLGGLMFCRNCIGITSAESWATGYGVDWTPE